MAETVMIDTPDILHLPPRVVPLKRVEDELSILREEGLGENVEGAALLRACTLTLVVLCDKNEDPSDLSPLVTELVESHPARVILLAQNEPKGQGAIETRISSYTAATSFPRRLVGEEIAFYPRGAQSELLPSAVLALRVSGLPFILYWRGQPDLDDPLFHGLVGECDQILFDSQHFTARAERINNTIARLRLEYPDVSFGDVNWQRIRPWREFVAQFFDDPANMEFLDSIARVEIDFSAGFNGNQSASILLMAWLASSLSWRVLPGSYNRDGLTRTARFERHPYGEDEQQIEVVIRVLEQEDCMPGELTGVRIKTRGDAPDAIFQVRRQVGGYAQVRELTPTRYSERVLMLNIPQDSNVVSSELDAPRRDRNYHRALELLDSLVAPHLEQNNHNSPAT